MKDFLGQFKDRFLKEKFSVGFDLGASTIKVVKLRSLAEGGIELCDFNFEPVQKDLKPIFKKIRQSLKTRRINISISGPATIIRYVNFPKMEQGEFNQSLKFEAEKNIPFTISEVNIDGYILKPDLPENKMLVLIAAAKKEFVNERLKLVENVGFRVKLIDIDSLALINAFNFNYLDEADLKGKTIALLNIGATGSNLNILTDGTPYLSRDIVIAGDSFTQRFADVLGMDFNAAEDYKLNPDREKSDKANAAMEAVLLNLTNEIRRSIDYYESQSASSPVKIFLSGGGTKLLGLKEKMAELLGIEVEYWDPLRKISVTGNIDQQKLKELSNQLAVAVGSALHP